MLPQNTFDASTDAATVSAAIAQDGYAIIAGALDEGQLAAMRGDLATHLDAAHTGHEEFMGTKTKRFGALLAKSQAVQMLLMHPAVLAAADAALLPHCARYHVHYTGVMHLEPGEKAQVLHRDTGIYPFANPCPPMTLATMWAISDFTEANGGTRLVPGSHLWDDARVPRLSEVVSCEMPAGSVLIYTGNVLHGGGDNASNAPRTGIALHYNLGWLRQEENQYLAVPAEVARALPREVRELMGYALGSPHLGFVDHVAPDDYLNGERDPANSNLSPEGLMARSTEVKRIAVSGSARVAERYYDVTDD
jgi:ectoine hydroxylase-related dioxygenase (phytanoyl-CoA dioxygenase family)